MPGLPTLQNAFGNGGITLALNAGFGSGSSTYAAAGSYSPGTGKFVLSGGAGLFSPENGDGRGAWGIRGSANLFSAMGGALGVGAFAGVGGGGRGGAKEGTPLNEAPTGEAFTLLPVGASIGYRRALGPTRGISLYTTPSFVWYNTDAAGQSTGLVRVAAGIDIGLATSFGITAGVEFGQSADPGSLAPGGTVFGVGLSYVMGSR
jgi:hypothetical protein